MRAYLLAALAATAFLAGCSDSGSDNTNTPVDPGANMNTTAMEPLHWENRVIVGGDPFNFIPATPVGGGAPCSTQASTCFLHDFTVNETTSLKATLKWGLAANDLDLYLYQDSNGLSNDGINSIPPAAALPTTTQILNHADLVAGTYTFWVVVWNAVNDGYTLDVEFS